MGIGVALRPWANVARGGGKGEKIKERRKNGGEAKRRGGIDKKKQGGNRGAKSAKQHFQGGADFRGKKPPKRGLGREGEALKLPWDLTRLVTIKNGVGGKKTRKRLKEPKKARGQDGPGTISPTKKT